MRTRWLWVLLLVTCLLLAAAGVAWAHVRILPEEVPADNFEVFTVRVPTEKDIPTTEVRVEVPEGFTVSRVQPMPSWDYELEEEAGAVRAITWSGGEIGATEFQQFDVQGKTPEEPGEYPWRAFQTYDDGSLVEWVGPEDSEEPASVVRVAEGGAEGGHNGAALQKSGSEALSSTGTITPIVAYGGLGVGILALIVATVALLRRNK
ncbi:MAG TPA: YcnI family protein [Rubrobacteraceae bacterium]|nr:YcnI family protein [Rubrobacteraceae bacterium]